MQIHETRRRNLRALVGQLGGPTRVAAKLNFANASYISQLVGPHPSREIGEHAARSIEAKLELTPGWMDRPHMPEPDGREAALLAECLLLTTEASKGLPAPLSPRKQADLVMVAFEAARTAGHVDPMLVRRLVRLSGA